MRRYKKVQVLPDYFRSVIFGFEDSLVSTTGVVIGVSIGTTDHNIIILTSFVTIAVEALSMAAGQYLSEKSVHQLESKPQKDSLLIDSACMFISYILGGLVPVIPIIVWSAPIGPVLSLVCALLGLFLLGYVKGKIVGVRATKSALEMMVIGGLAAIVGTIVGWFLKA